MKIGFVGLGKLGLPCALAAEAKGHDVAGYDINPGVINILRTRSLPYVEKGAQELLDKTMIRFLSMQDLVTFSDIIFVAVQTPHVERYEGITRIPPERVDFDYTYLVNSLKDLSKAVEASGVTSKTVVVISTVLPGTVEEKVKPVLSPKIKLCYNPFFIAMGTTIQDFLNPEFVLFGVDDADAAQQAANFYATLHNKPFYKTTVKNAELIKVSYNTFIGLKIAFVNTLMEICEKTGADVDAVTDALKLATERLISGKYMSGGMGDGGGCHPRDNIALSWLARKLDLSYDLFDSLMLCREKQTDWLADLVQDQMKLHPDLPVTILGKSFKPESNLTVGSPAVLLKNILDERGVPCDMYDPFVDGLPTVPAVSSHGPQFAVTGLHPPFKPGIFFVGTKHTAFIMYQFPVGSVVLDPFRFISDQPGVKVIRIGQGK